ncbi:hypothetical protein [Flavobacterium sp.]|nr:hypothetical protein [Flavobacterium sp.]
MNKKVVVLINIFFTTTLSSIAQVNCEVYSQNHKEKWWLSYL